MALVECRHLSDNGLGNVTVYTNSQWSVEARENLILIPYDIWSFCLPLI